MKTKPEVLTPEQQHVQEAWNALRAACKKSDIPLQLHFYDGAHKPSVIFDRENLRVLILDGTPGPQGEQMVASIDVLTLERILPFLGWALVKACDAKGTR